MKCSSTVGPKVPIASLVDNNSLVSVRKIIISKYLKMTPDIWGIQKYFCNLFLILNTLLLYDNNEATELKYIKTFHYSLLGKNFYLPGEGPMGNHVCPC